MAATNSAKLTPASGSAAYWEQYGHVWLRGNKKKDEVFFFSFRRYD